MSRKEFWEWMDKCPSKIDWTIVEDDGVDVTIQFDVMVSEEEFEEEQWMRDSGLPDAGDDWHDEDENGVSKADMYMEDLEYD